MSLKINVDKSYCFWSLVLGLFSIFIYANTLGHNFIWDDGKFIIQSHFIQHWENSFKIFTSDYYKLSWREADVNRPVMVASLILDYSIWQLNPLGYHLTNILLHAANTVILLFILRLLLPNTTAVVFGAVIFAVHPLHTEAVNAINFREDLLVTFFFLLSFFLFLKGLMTDKMGIVGAFSLLFYTCALFSKESAVTLPAIVLLYCWICNKKIPKLLISCYLLLTGFCIIWLWHIHQYSNLTKVAYLPFSDRLYIGVNAIGRYLWLHLFPFNLIADYEVSSFSAKSISTVITTCSVAFIAIGAVYAVMIKKGIESFLLGWFFITLLPIMNIVPLHNPVAERYLYLPSVGIIVLATLLMDKGISSTKAKISLLIVIVIMFSLTTSTRNTVWRDDYYLWSDTIRKTPQNIRVRNNLRNAYYDIGVSKYRNGDFDEAVQYLNSAIAIDPSDAKSYNVRGVIYHLKGENDEAIRNYNMAIAFNSNDADFYNNRGLAYHSKGEYEKARKDYDMAISLNPNDPIYYCNRGETRLMTDKKDLAVSDFRKACDMGSTYGCSKLLSFNAGR